MAFGPYHWAQAFFFVVVAARQWAPNGVTACNNQLTQKPPWKLAQIFFRFIIPDRHKCALSIVGSVLCVAVGRHVIGKPRQYTWLVRGWMRTYRVILHSATLDKTLFILVHNKHRAAKRYTSYTLHTKAYPIDRRAVAGEKSAHWILHKIWPQFSCSPLEKIKYSHNPCVAFRRCLCVVPARTADGDGAMTQRRRAFEKMLCTLRIYSSHTGDVEYFVPHHPLPLHNSANDVQLQKQKNHQNMKRKKASEKVSIKITRRGDDFLRTTDAHTGHCWRGTVNV